MAFVGLLDTQKDSHLRLWAVLKDAIDMICQKGTAWTGSSQIK